MTGEKEIALAVIDAADWGKVFLKRDTRTGQVLKAIKAEIWLFEKAGHIYKIPGRQERWAITCDGYARLNKAAGISILTPAQVVVDGQTRPNPFIERDPATGLITAVHIRKQGIGYGPLGQVVLIDKTLYFNCYAYFLQSLQAKQAWSENDEKGNSGDLTLIGIKSEPPTAQGKWIFFPAMGELGIWANYANARIRQVIADSLQRQRFADRIAQRIVERNILKAHPAIGMTTTGQVKQDANRGAYMIAQVYGYRTEERPEELAEQAVEIVRERIEAQDLTEEDRAEEKAAVEDATAESPAEELPLFNLKKENKDESYKKSQRNSENGSL